MARFLAGSSLFAILALFATGLAGAQVNPGTPSFSAYDSHQYDTVNLQNLSVSLNIPVMSKNGAFPFNAALTGGDSYISFKGGTLQPGILATPLTPSINGVLSPFGYAQVLPAATTTVTCPSGDGDGSAYEYKSWYLQFPDGTVHSLPATDIVYGGASCSTTLTDQVIDGSGWTLTINGGLFYSSSQAGVTIVSSAGAIISSGENSTSVQDTQPTPNKISYNVSQQTYTDTLGTDVLTVNANTDGTLGWYDVNGGYPTESQTLTDSTLKTSFGCSGKPDYPATDGAYLTTAIAFPDGTSLGLAWEPNEVTSADYTGRLATITMRNGSSTIAYNYNPSSGANYGLNCTYLIPNQITRTTSDGVTTYSWMATNTVGSNYASTTTVVDNGGNKSIYVFTGLTATGDAAPPVTQALTQVYHYQGSSTLLTTDIYCYNAASGQPGNCGTAVVSLPITEVDVYHTIYGMSTSSRTQTKYDKYGNVTYSAQYDFGASSPTVATTTTYGSWNGSNHCYSFSSTINNRPCQVLTTQNGNTVAESRFTYDSYGNLLTTYVWNGSSFLSNSTQNSYNSNGTIATSYDLAGNITTYTYSSGSYTSCGSCTNFPFPTSVSKGGLTTYSTWNGTGGVKLTDIDANNDSTTYGYASCSGNTADPLWRLMSVTDPLGNEACKTYPSGSSPVTISSSSSFNSGNSVQNTTTTADGYGRKINVQQQQGPLATTYDTLTTAYGWSTNYRTVATSQPCSATAAGSCTLAHTNYLDPLGRLYKETTTSNETLTNTYTQNDVLSALTPAPSGENPKQVQKQYDGLGRSTASCKIESSGGTSCGQKTGSASGVVTTTMYSSATGSQAVSTTRGSQTRSKTVDGLGRVTQKMTPEGGTWNYYYDSYSSCPTGYQGASGQLAAVKDPNGNLLCYAHDSLGRVTGVNANGTTCRHFYYDNSTGYSGSIPSGVSTPTNPYGRMVEAATDACSAGTLITDEWFSYDKDGHATDMWEYAALWNVLPFGRYICWKRSSDISEVCQLTPTANITSLRTRWRGCPSTLITYNQTIVAGTTFNAASQPLDIDIGTGTDEDQI